MHIASSLCVVYDGTVKKSDQQPTRELPPCAISQVRYLWAGEPHSDSLLYNASDLQASPFILAVSR